MKELFEALKKILAANEAAVLCTVLESEGSVPRSAGAKMLVAACGRVCGTVGGGAVEHEAEQLALKALMTSESCVKSFRLTKNSTEDIGMVCGGNTTLYFQYIPAGNEDALQLAEHALAMIAAGERSWLISDIGSGILGAYGGQSGCFGLPLTAEELHQLLASRPLRKTLDGRDLFIEPLVLAGRVYIFGGGHVSQELVPALARVGFRCVVLDDREEFVEKALFPGVEDTMLTGFDDILFLSQERKSMQKESGEKAKSLMVTPHDYIVIMTRGHKYDSAIQAKAMKTQARYIGVMGSRHKIAHVSKQMRALGFTDEDLARIHTPIGLPIKAETPAEIAVSIAAELIQVRAEGCG